MAEIVVSLDDSELLDELSTLAAAERALGQDVRLNSEAVARLVDAVEALTVVLKSGSLTFDTAVKEDDPLPYGMGEPQDGENATAWNLAAFNEAIARGLSVRFTYERPPGRFQPVWETERTDRWYKPVEVTTIGTGLVEHSVVSGYDLVAEEPRNFRLDRIAGFVRVEQPGSGGLSA